MGRERRSRVWWSSRVARWRRSGLTARHFAESEGLSVFSLRWWSSQFGPDNRAEHGASAIEPIEITVEAGRSGRGLVEVVVGAATIRCEPGMDVGYIAALVRAIAGA
jgi:hypothetical protein